MTFNRRDFLQNSSLAALGLAVQSAIGADKKRPPRVLLRSSWQTVNIGDIAHTPGVLSILRQYLPEELVNFSSRQTQFQFSKDWFYYKVLAVNDA